MCNNKIKFILFGIGISGLGIIILISMLITLDFFGGEILNTEYIEGNMEYAYEYQNVLNKHITNNLDGYIPLSRILYFYNEDSNLSFESIYKNNIDSEFKTMKFIEDVCLESYKFFDVCTKEKISNSNQSNEFIYKPFNAPIKFDKTTITSFFGQERIVYDNFDIHYAWDFAATSKTPVYSVGYGIVSNMRFEEKENTIDTSKGIGNYIEITYEINDESYKVLYGHLYPNSAKVKIGDKVLPWQEIAKVGTTGYSTGNHLHWEVSKNNKKIDGMNLIDFTL